MHVRIRPEAKTLIEAMSKHLTKRWGVEFKQGQVVEQALRLALETISDDDKKGITEEINGIGADQLSLLPDAKGASGEQSVTRTAHFVTKVGKPAVSLLIPKNQTSRNHEGVRKARAAIGSKSPRTRGQPTPRSGKRRKA